MATKSFLDEAELDQALELLKPPERPPSGRENEALQFRSLEFSAWLSGRVLNELSAHPDWQRAGPVALGSWARGELCPKSDIDLLFCGEEQAVKRLVTYLSEQPGRRSPGPQNTAPEGSEPRGALAQNAVVKRSRYLKIRYRVPADPDDWTVGVLPFDIFALLSAVGLTPEAEAKLAVQWVRLEGKRRQLRRRLLSAVVDERQKRAQRYDSMANFLEPNLKYGPGGLRDLEQALSIYRLFEDKYSHFDQEGKHAQDVLQYYKRFFLLVRQRLHLSDGGGDILSAGEQKPIAEWLKYKDPKLFMREIQKGLARVSFYADWVIELASKSEALIEQIEKYPLKTVKNLFSAIRKEPSILMQSRVRIAGDKIFSDAVADESTELGVVVGRGLSQMISPSNDQDVLIAFFKSRLLDHCVRDFRRIVGHVQHDQYHRFSVDAHILQALRELGRVQRKPSLVGRLATEVKAMTDLDWQVLAFSCLYHDIAKGREGGHHADRGREIAKRDLQWFQKKENFIDDVCWVVEQHLTLSAAAFRENSKSKRTWAKLIEQGAIGRRLRLLSVFTVVDIRATNPDAWTPWKERLMVELVEQLRKPESGRLLDFVAAYKTQLSGSSDIDEKMIESVADALDPFLLGSLPVKLIAQDLAELRLRMLPAGVRVAALRGGKQTWIRFHFSHDRPGLFLHLVNALTAAGLSIRHASVHTLPEVGVYDWFEVKTQKPAQAIVNHLRHAIDMPGDLTVTGCGRSHAAIYFQSVDSVGGDVDEWVISFRGRDQSGALSEAARILYSEGAQIRWAKVHTWGRQIDDVFGIDNLSTKTELSSDEFVARLRARLQFD